MSDTEFKAGDEFEARVKLISPTTIPGKPGVGPVPAWYVRSPDGHAYVVCESSLRAARRVEKEVPLDDVRINSMRTDYGTADIPEGAKWAGGWSSAGLPVRYEDGRKRTIPWTHRDADKADVAEPADYRGPYVQVSGLDANDLIISQRKTQWPLGFLLTRRELSDGIPLAEFNARLRHLCAT